MKLYITKIIEIHKKNMKYPNIYIQIFVIKTLIFATNIVFHSIFAIYYLYCLYYWKLLISDFHIFLFRDFIKYFMKFVFVIVLLR